MKRYIYRIISALLVCTIILPSCTKDFEEVNTDPIATPNAQPSQLLAPALVSVLSANMSRNRSFNNELMQVTVNLSDDEAAVFRYEFRSTQADYLWNSWYPQLTNFKDIYKKASDPLTLSKQYQGISLIMQTYLYSLLTDTYGDIPYHQSNKARDSIGADGVVIPGIIEPVFDKQKDIYLDMFKKLEAANELLRTNTGNVDGQTDPLFKGKVANWRKFGNSLYLRLLLRASGKADVADVVLPKIKEIVDTKASTYPKFTSNADNAILRWTGSGVYISPFNSIREQDFRSPAIGAFFMERLRSWASPFINTLTYGVGGYNRFSIAQGKAGFAGVPSGYISGQQPVKQSYFYSNSEDRSLQTDTETGIIMTFSELQFILAELRAKDLITTGNAESYWKNGILNNITQWLPTWPNKPTEAVPSPAITITSPEFLTYLSDADIAWDNSLPLDAPEPSSIYSAPNSIMEQIHIHKYYALFLTDLQQWIEYRRTGHPFLPKGPGLRNGGVMPARMNYPVYVQSANPTNYKLAVAEQGPDRISTEVWWQKKP